MRVEALKWLRRHAGERALFGGDLNTSRPTMQTVLRNPNEFTYLHEPDHKHGDLAVAKNLPRASSEACSADRTSDAHKMCIVMLQNDSDDAEAAPPHSAAGQASHSAAKPAETTQQQPTVEALARRAKFARAPRAGDRFVSRAKPSCVAYTQPPKPPPAEKGTCVAVLPEGTEFDAQAVEAVLIPEDPSRNLLARWEICVKTECTYE